MKLRPNLTHPPISKHEVVHHTEKTRTDMYQEYEHPWYTFNKKRDMEATILNKPNPPSKEAVERAKFVDKTYIWDWSDSVRSRNKRTTK